MSKRNLERVSVEIGGLKLGLRVEPEVMLKLISAMQEYYVANRIGSPTGKALIACDEAFDKLVDNIRESAQQHALKVISKS